MDNLIGLQVREVDLPEAPLLSAAELSNTGVVGIFERGVPNKPIRVTNDVQLRQRFSASGIPVAGQLGLIGIRELFANASPYGMNVYVSRVVGTGALEGTAAAQATDQLRLKSIHRAAGVPAQVWITVEAGTSQGVKVTFENDSAAPTITEIYDNLVIETLVGAINYGLSGHTQSVLAKVVAYSDILPTIAAQAAFILDTPEYYHEEVTAAGADIVLKSGQRGVVDPGVWANDYGYKFVIDPANPALRTLEIYKLVDGAYTLVDNSLNGLTSTDWMSLINSASQGSIYAMVSAGAAYPAESDAVVPFASGADGTAPTMTQMIGTSAAKSGLYALSDSPIQIATCFDLYFSSAMEDDAVEYAAALDTFCETIRKRCIGVINVPQDWDLEAIEYTESTNSVKWPALLRPSSWLAVFAGWGAVDSEAGDRVMVPACAGVIGAGFIRRMYDEGGLPFIAPAGPRATIRNFSSMDREIYNDTDLDYLTHTLGINAVMLLAGIGYVARTSRLMSTLNKNYDIHKRRVIHYLADTFQTGLTFLEQAPNTPETRSLLVQTLDFTMQPLYNKGMFDKTSGYDGAISIKCDTDNNTEDDVLNRRLNCQLAVKIVGVVEVAYINIANVERTISIEES